MRFKRVLTFALAIFMAVSCLCTSALAEYDKPYYIDVDLTNQIITVYNTEDNSVAMQCLTSSGTVGHETPQGVYYLPAKDRDDERSEWYNFYALGVYAKWATRIINGYLFHSIPCRRPDLDYVVEKYVDQFGMPASHGCLRMRVEDAEFIAKNCLRGTRVTIYESGELDEDLRSLLYISSYHASEGLGYQEFLGVSDDALGRGSTGNEVLDLQYRLTDLGYYGEEPDGVYDTTTISAVKRLQKDMGLAQNGITTDSMLEVIYSDDAPVSNGVVTLTEGKSGPVVKKLQTALQQLGVYTEDLDSIYDLGVTEAIKTFQDLCGYDVDGEATPEIQQCIYYQIAQLEEMFGEGSVPAAEYVTEEILKGTVDAELKIKIREEMDTESRELTKVSPGDTVLILDYETDDKWCNVVANGKTGYMYQKYLDPYTEENVIIQFSDGSKVYTLGRTMEERLSGADTIAEEFSEYYASEQFTSSVDDTVDYVTVNTGSDDVRLNLRAEGSSEGAILAEVPNGTDLRVLSNDGEWTRVGYNEEIGYLMNQYLTFWEGSSDELSDGSDEYVGLEDIDYEAMAVEELKAIVIGETYNEEGTKLRPYLYEEPSRRADKLSILEEGAQVEVLEFCEEEGWVQIQYFAQTGYMYDACLNYQFEGA